MDQGVRVLPLAFSAACPQVLGRAGVEGGLCGRGVRTGAGLVRPLGRAARRLQRGG